MTQATHARLWHSLPSLYPEIATWGSLMGPFQFVVTYNENTKVANASVKRAGLNEAATLIGTFPGKMEAFVACEKYYRDSLS